MAFPSTAQLKRAIELKQKLESLENELQSILGDHRGISRIRRSGRRRRMSAASRARVNGKAATKPGRKARRKMSAAVKAKLAAIARKRWRLAKAAGKSAL